MFRNKLLLRAKPPFPLYCSFFTKQLTISHPLPFPPSFSFNVDSLCWKLSRKWCLACIYASTKIHIVYMKSQSENAAEAIKEISENLPTSDVEEEEVGSSSLITKAIECGLISALLNSSWSCLDNGIIVHSRFSFNEEKTPLYALHVMVQANSDGDFFIIVSPEVVHFSRLKIVDLVGSKTEQRFQFGEEVSVDYYSLATSCSVLPSAFGGHVIVGVSRSLPSGEDLQQLQQLWSFKHGLLLTEDYFFMKVHITDGVHGDKQWFPSTFVLQGSGLMPVRQTIRASKAICALDFFIKTVEAWDFFDAGWLKISGACRLDTGSELPVWAKATKIAPVHLTTKTEQSNLHINLNRVSSSLKTLLSARDFRTSKPAPRAVSHNHDTMGVEIQETSVSAGACIRDDGSIKTMTKFRPLFMNRKSVRSFRPDKVVETELPLLPVTRSKRTCLLDGSVPQDNAVNEKHDAPESVVREGKFAILKDTGNLQMSSKTSRKKGYKKISFDKRPNAFLKESVKVPPLAEPEEMLSDQQNKIVEVDEQSMPKKRIKQQTDPDKVYAKVMDYHARGLLQSLTVPELKGFLSVKKAKVGGKKEELILRVTALLT